MKFWLKINKEDFYSRFNYEKDELFRVQFNSAEYYNTFDELLEKVRERKLPPVIAAQCVLPADEITKVVRLAVNNLLASDARETDYFDVEVIEILETKDYSNYKCPS